MPSSLTTRAKGWLLLIAEVVMILIILGLLGLIWLPTIIAGHG